MAVLQTKTFSWGSYDKGSDSNAYVFDLILTENSVSAENNTSSISFKLVLNSGSYNRFTGQIDSVLKLNGVAVASGSKYITAAYNSSWTLQEGTVDVKHNDDGTLTMPISVSITTYNEYAPPTGTKTDEWELTKIDLISACIPPTSFTATPGPIFENGITFTWSGSGDGINNKVEQHVIDGRYSQDGVTWSEWETVWLYTNNGIVELSNEYMTIEGLPMVRGYFYQFRIASIGTAGWNYKSDWKVCGTTFQMNRLPYVVPAGTLEEYSPHFTVKDPSTGNILSVFTSGSEVLLSWTYFQDPDGNLKDGRFEVQYMTLPDGKWTDLLQIDNPGQGHYSDYRHCPDEVGPGETVQYRVRAVDALGAASEDWIVSDTLTRNSAPSAPAGGKISKNEYSPGDALIVSWAGIEDPDGNVSGCRVYWAVSDRDEAPEQYALLAEVETDGAGEYGFVPDQAKYHQYLHLYLQAVDSLGACSEVVHVGAIRRNDDPFVAIGGKTYLVTVGKKKYMPVIRKNGQIFRLGKG